MGRKRLAVRQKDLCHYHRAGFPPDRPKVYTDQCPRCRERLGLPPIARVDDPKATA